jgi:hypothetical protein
VRLGDQRAKLRELLGAPSSTTDSQDDYRGSGVAAWFDAEGRVTKLKFTGAAGSSPMYANEDTPFLPSAGAVVFGLTPLVDEPGFKKLLGAPATESASGDLRCEWKRSGYVIAAVFMRKDGLGLDGIEYPKGTLLSFEVSRGR